MVLLADSAPHETGAFLPIRRLLRGWLGSPDTDKPGGMARRLRAMAESLDPGLLTVIPALSWLLDLPVDDPDWMRLGASQRQRSIIGSVLALLTAQARRGPVVIVADDLHWADDESIAVIDGLVRILPSAAILLLATYRPGFRDTWTAHSSYTLCHLDPLTDEHADALLGRLLGAGEDLEPVKRGLIRRAEGNPLFLEEMARALVETGRLEGRPGAYRVVGEADDLGLPATVQDVIAARIGLLGALEKQVLQTAAVLGRTVPVDLLLAVCPLGDELVLDALASLDDAEFLYQTRFLPSAEYRFKHELTRQVAYGSLPRTRRAALHAAAAAAMETLWAGSLGGVVDALADHCEAGEQWEKAARYLIQAAAKAKSRYGLAQAISLAGRGLAAAEKTGDPDERVRDRGLDPAGRPAEPARRSGGGERRLRAGAWAGGGRRTAPEDRQPAAPPAERHPRRRADRLLRAWGRGDDPGLHPSLRLRPAGLPAADRGAVPGVPDRHDRSARHRRFGPAGARLRHARPRRGRPGGAGRGRARRTGRRGRDFPWRAAADPARRASAGTAEPDRPGRRLLASDRRPWGRRAGGRRCRRT